MNIASLPKTSPDGRFEVKIDVWYDRASPQEDTVVIERATQREVARFHQPMEAGFTADGLLHLDRPYWLGTPLQFDPQHAMLRDRADAAWMPLDLWRLGAQAYSRGWNQGREHGGLTPASDFPWPEAGVAAGALAAAALFVWLDSIDTPARIALIVVALLLAVFFLWIFTQNVRVWRRARRERAAIRVPTSS